MSAEQNKTTEELKKDFDDLREPSYGEKRIYKKIEHHPEAFQAQIDFVRSISKEIFAETDDVRNVYPSAGLIHTKFDNIETGRSHSIEEEVVIRTLAMRLYFVEMSNHPYRIEALNEVNNKPYQPPAKCESNIFYAAQNEGVALAIGDIASEVRGDGQQSRTSRTEVYGRGLYIKLGKQARIPFTGSESPDVWNSSMAIATLAASHALAIIPRNGVLSDIERQVDFAKEVFTQLDILAEIILDGRPDKEIILQMWKNNVLGTVEPSTAKALKRAEALYEGAGIRGFRPYSPEPGDAIINTTNEIRRIFGPNFEIASGQITSKDQGKRAEQADLIVIGVGGGGRCTTGIRSGTAIDWPKLVWDLRGEIDKPIVVQGGATDHVATTLLLGASGISGSRIIAGGTIESPGGALYLKDENGRLYKIYGGEASARNKLLDGKLLPFGLPAFVEGETTKAYINFLENALPTLAYNLHKLMEDATLALVFRGVQNIHQLHAINPSPLTRITTAGDFQRNTH